MKRFLLGAGATLAFAFSIAQVSLAQTIGETKTVTIPVCRTDVGWNGSSSINNTYAAPAGWQIISFVPIVISKRQRAQYSFTQVPSNSGSLSIAEASQKFNELLDVAAQNGNKGKYEGRINQMRNDYERYHQKVFATHSQIVTTGRVRGNNDFTSRRPGRLYLDLQVVLAYYPDTPQQFEQSLAVMKQIIEADKVN